MQPRTKHQFYIHDLFQSLPKITAKIQPWAFENCIDHLAYRTKKDTSCLSCGHIWKGEATIKKEVCPSCARKLKVSDTRHKTISQRRFITSLTVVEDYQVIRFFELHVHHKAGQAPEIIFWEIMQQWLKPTGEFELVARNRGGMGWYNDGFHGDLELRNKHSFESKFNLQSEGVYPEMKVLPIYKRNGFKGKFGWVTPYDMFTFIIKNSKAETLLKAGQLTLLGKLTNAEGGKVERYWDSIKICMRNGFKINDKNYNLWFDYLDMLRWFGKDLRNAKFICPVNLKAEHDRLVAMRTAIQTREREERERASKELAQKWVDNAEDMYKQLKGAFFGIVFTEKDLTIKVLESVQEFIQEAEAHGHCVYSSEYYKRADSLVLSARVKGKPAETIEVSLSRMKIEQSRGLANGDPNGTTKHHNKIIQLVKKNLPVIQKRMKEAKKHQAVEIAA